MIFPYDAAVPDPSSPGPAANPSSPSSPPVAGLTPPPGPAGLLAAGTPAFPAERVQGRWRSLQGVDDVLALLETGAAGIVAGVADAGATFLAPILEDLAGVVCTAGTPRSHVAIVSRDFGVPALMGARFTAAPPVDGTLVELDCSRHPGHLRAVQAP